MPDEQTMYLLQLVGSLNVPSKGQAKIDLIVVVEAVGVDGALVVVTGVVEEMVVVLVVVGAEVVVD